MIEQSVPVLDANGAFIPVLGLGTSIMRGAACAKAVEAAFGMGYRHIDTAVMYGNEIDVGAGLRASGVKRAEAFITTKVLPTEIGPGDLQRSAEGSLTRLQLDVVDLLLIHWPNPAIPLAQSIEALCDAKARGLTKHIGVANFTTAMLNEAVKLAEGQGEQIVCNQCEYHPRLDQTKVLDACRDKGAVFVAYSPLAQGRYFDDPALAGIAKAHQRKVSQVMLRWLVQQDGVAAIPKASSQAHLLDNISIFDFSLSDDEMRAISELMRPSGRFVTPGFSPQWDS